MDDRAELSEVAMAANWNEDVVKSLYWDEEKRSDEDVKNEWKSNQSCTMYRTMVKGDRSKIIKAVRGGGIVGSVMLEVFDWADLEGREAGPVTILERRTTKPSRDLEFGFAQRLREWSMNFGVAFDVEKTQRDVQILRAESVPFIWLSGLSVIPKMRLMGIGRRLFMEAKKYAASLEMGMLFVSGTRCREFHNGCGSTYDTNTTGARFPLLVSWIPGAKEQVTIKVEDIKEEDTKEEDIKEEYIKGEVIKVEENDLKVWDYRL